MNECVSVSYCYITKYLTGLKQQTVVILYDSVSHLGGSSCLGSLTALCWGQHGLTHISDSAQARWS